MNYEQSRYVHLDHATYYMYMYLYIDLYLSMNGGSSQKGIRSMHTPKELRAK
jgi:hypothetical protein